MSCDTLTLSVNGADHAVTVGSSASLMMVLRNDLELNSPKYGCGLGECGACTVLIDGIAARSCVVPAVHMPARVITTLEGLSPSGVLHPVQRAFIDAQAAQCGYCLNGMIMMTVALLARNAHPTEDEIRRELSHNLCRCGAHVEIVDAVLLAVRYYEESTPALSTSSSSPLSP